MGDDFFHSDDSFESIDLHSIVVRPASLIDEHTSANANANANAIKQTNISKKYNFSFNKRAKIIPLNEKQSIPLYKRFFCCCKKK